MQFLKIYRERKSRGLPSQAAQIVCGGGCTTAELAVWESGRSVGRAAVREIHLTRGVWRKRCLKVRNLYVCTDFFFFLLWMRAQADLSTRPCNRARKCRFRVPMRRLRSRKLRRQHRRNHQDNRGSYTPYGRRRCDGSLSLSDTDEQMSGGDAYAPFTLN